LQALHSIMERVMRKAHACEHNATACTAVLDDEEASKRAAATQQRSESETHLLQEEDKKKDEEEGKSQPHRPTTVTRTGVQY
jgi:hypothetical protein